VNVNRIHIKNFKSIVDLSLELAPINVFIGENGSGKSNILEALAFAAAAAADKLDNEFLVSRGIRVTEPRFMRSAFAEVEDGAVWIEAEDDQGLRASFEINTSGDAAYPKWSSHKGMQMPGGRFAPSNAELASMIAERLSIEDSVELKELVQLISEPPAESSKSKLADDLKNTYLPLFFFLLRMTYPKALLSDFIIYSPEITALRTFEKEGQILPLGVRGEGC